MPHVFLSYCREDIAEASRLRNDLNTHGIDVWWDQLILPGQDWKHTIREAMKQRSAVLLCLSSQCLQRTRAGIYPEALDAIAAYRQQRPDEIFLIPVRFSLCEIPSIEIDDTRTLDRLQGVDLFPADRWNNGIERIILSINHASSHITHSGDPESYGANLVSNNLRVRAKMVVSPFSRLAALASGRSIELPAPLAFIGSVALAPIFLTFFLLTVGALCLFVAFGLNPDRFPIFFKLLAPIVTEVLVGSGVVIIAVLALVFRLASKELQRDVNELPGREVEKELSAKESSDPLQLEGPTVSNAVTASLRRTL